jgi:chromosome segregation ATPase
LSSRKAEREIRTAKDEVSQYKAKMEDAEQKLRQVSDWFDINLKFNLILRYLKVEMEKKSLNDRIQRQETDWRKERDQLMSRATDLEVEMKVQRDGCYNTF